MDQSGIGNNFLKLDIGKGQKHYILHGPNMRRKQCFRINLNHTLSDFDKKKAYQSIGSEGGAVLAENQQQHQVAHIFEQPQSNPDLPTMSPAKYRADSASSVS